MATLQHLTNNYQNGIYQNTGTSVPTIANAVIQNTTSSTVGQWIKVNSTSTTNYLVYNEAVEISNDRIINPENINDRLGRDGLDLGNDRVLRYDLSGNIVLYHTHSDGKKVSTAVPTKHRGVIDLKSRLIDIDTGTIIRLPDGTFLELDRKGEVIRESYVNISKRIIDVVGGNYTLYESLAYGHFHEIHIGEGLNTKATFILPNGVKINLFPDDRIEIDESDGKQIYKSAPIREFNKFLNVSDVLEDFIGYCADQRISQKDFSELPINLFIYWLIVKAAEADGDDPGDATPMLTHAVRNKKLHKHKCKCCGKFLSKKYETHGISFCGPDHLELYSKRIG